MDAGRVTPTAVFKVERRRHLGALAPTGLSGTAFSLVLAGGGLRHRGAYGTTDDTGKKILQHPVSIPDFHATIHAALNIDPSKELMDGSRPVPITDGGQPIRDLFA